MPKRKTVDNNVPEPAAAVVDVKKRSKSAASKPNTPAATHKRATKKPMLEEPAIVAAVKAPVHTQPVRTPSSDEIARKAYSYWEARGCQHGSPEADWLRAEQELLELAKNR